MEHMIFSKMNVMRT